MKFEIISELVNSVPNLATIKVYLQLYKMSKVDNNGVSTTKKAVADELKLSYPIIFSSFKWLKENGYIKETKVNGQTKFILPEISKDNKKQDHLPVNEDTQSVEISTKAEVTEKAERPKRGRKRKNIINVPKENVKDNSAAAAPKRKRGRPRKYPKVEEIPVSKE